MRLPFRARRPAVAPDWGLPTSAFGTFGPGSVLHHPVRIFNAHRIHIGSGVTIGQDSWLSVVEEHNDQRFEPVLRIGDGTSLGRDTIIACIGEVVIGARVLTADRVFIGDTYHDYRDPAVAIIDQPMAVPRPVHIGDGAFLGINSVVLPGVTVGERAFVGAGAVVVDDVPANTVVAGNPARVVRRWDAEAGAWHRP